MGVSFYKSRGKDAIIDDDALDVSVFSAERIFRDLGVIGQSDEGTVGFIPRDEIPIWIFNLARIHAKAEYIDSAHKHRNERLMTLMVLAYEENMGIGWS